MVGNKKSRLHMPRVLDTKAVLDAWIGVLVAQYKSGHMSYGRYIARCRQAREKWAHELRCYPPRAAEPYYGTHPQGEQTTQ
jgi:hypothetical protein